MLSLIFGLFSRYLNLHKLDNKPDLVQRDVEALSNRFPEHAQNDLLVSLLDQIEPSRICARLQILFEHQL